MVKLLSQFFKEYSANFWAAIALASATLLAGIGLMATSGYLISMAALADGIAELFVITAAVRFFGISRAVMRYLERLVAHDFTFKILHGVRVWFYRQLSENALTWIMGKRSGDLLAKSITDTETLQNAYLRVVLPAIVAAIVSLVTFLLLLTIDYRIAISTFLFLGASGIAHAWFAQKVSEGRGIEETTLKAKFKVLLVDRLQGLPEIHWLSQKQRTVAETNNLQAQLDRVQKKNAALSGLNDGMSSLISHLGMFSALVLATPEVLAGTLQGAMLAMVTLGVFSSFEAVQNLANAFQHIEKTKEAAKRLLEITKSSAQILLPPINSFPPANGIAFENVSFSYFDEQITLRDVSMWFPEGSKNAVVGPSGSGKSTLINLILNLWNPDSGSIFLNKKSIADYTPEELGSYFAVMAQDHHVFNRNIRENIRIANPKATSEQVEAVLKTTGLFETERNSDQLGLLAVSLSGGERQLLAFASLLLEDARCWILDEPWANLDTITERKIFDLMWSKIGNRTLILVTHRLVDMEKMDQIIVMDKGDVVESGTHNELLARNQLYAKMFEQQNQLF
ncbi:MAG TPA: thiol reductant ABC exporter subunit CydC [Bacteroidales bacterium]|nr:thiol reductant ABC exporter subunit CydC [Bacteroidales bacterium]